MLIDPAPLVGTTRWRLHFIAIGTARDRAVDIIACHLNQVPRLRLVDNAVGEVCERKGEGEGREGRV